VSRNEVRDRELDEAESMEGRRMKRKVMIVIIRESLAIIFQRKSPMMLCKMKRPGYNKKKSMI
jgi:hypothetical protein